MSPDGIPTERLKCIDNKGIYILIQLFNFIYCIGVLPKWLLSTFVPIPKKNDDEECSDHRTTALISHTLKAFLRVIQNRIRKKLDIEIIDTNYVLEMGWY